MMKYSQSHEWVLLKDGIATIGISDFIQKELGDVVHIELPQMGHHVSAGDEVVVLESSKAAADIYTPLSGEICAVNEALVQAPEKINRSAENHGWLFKLKITDLSEYENLMDKDSYSTFIS